MNKPKSTSRKKEPAHVVHKDKDLRIPDATPWQVAQALMRGKVQRKRAPKRV